MVPLKAPAGQVHKQQASDRGGLIRSLKLIGSSRNWIRFSLLLGVVLGRPFPMAAQTPAAAAQDRVAPTATIVRTVATSSFGPSFLLSDSLEKSAAHFSYPFAGPFERDRRLESLSPMREVKTLFLSQSSLRLVQLWSGRLRLDGFTSRLDMQNVQLGPSAAGGLLDFRPPRQGYPGGPRSIGLYGVNLSFHSGRDAQIGPPTQIWRSLTRIVVGRVVRP